MENYDDIIAVNLSYTILQQTHSWFLRTPPLHFQIFQTCHSNLDDYFQFSIIFSFDWPALFQIKLIWNKKRENDCLKFKPLSDKWKFEITTWDDKFVQWTSCPFDSIVSSVIVWRHHFIIIQNYESLNKYLGWVI